MVYTKRGPFVDASPSGPYLDHGWFDGVEAALSSPAANAITGWFHVDQFGAVGDGTTVDRSAIQAAINAANTAYVSTGAMQRVYFPGRTFIVDATNYVRDDGSTFGVTSLLLLDGVELFGSGTLKVKNGAYGSGAIYAIIRAKSTGLSNAAITGLTFDANLANVAASTQCSNVDMYIQANIRISGTQHLSANGNAVIVHGSGGPATNIEILDNTVLSARMIGLQCSHFNGLIIRGNYVANCTNNGIDIYGENSGSTVVDGTNFTITGNTITGCLTGVFPETVAQGVITGNVISNCTESGVHINRINGQPHDILVAENTITSTPYGVYVTGDTGGIVIRGNTCTGFTSAGIQLGGGGGNCSSILIDGNTLNPATSTVPLVSMGGNQISIVRIRGIATNATNRALDVVNTATTTVSLVVEPTYTGETRGTSGTVASGGTFTIPVSASAAGTVIIRGTAGGAWTSVWHGVWVSEGARVDVTALGSKFTTPGQLIASVAGSTTSLSMTVTSAASGSNGQFTYNVRQMTV